jgi:hypothetical protein
MATNPKAILSIIAIVLAAASYYPGVPTLGVAVILLGVANLIT